jgi:hypothetical protein
MSIILETGKFMNMNLERKLESFSGFSVLFLSRCNKSHNRTTWMILFSDELAVVGVFLACRGWRRSCN